MAKKKRKSFPPKKFGPKKFIAGAIKRPGALHRALGVRQGSPIPKNMINEAARAPGRLGRQARFAQTLASFNHGKRKSRR